MNAALRWIEAVFETLPLRLLEVWGTFGYLVALVLAVAAYGGFTFRPHGRWGLGFERQTWNNEAVLSVALTFVLVILTGYVGSFVVLVPGAQTLESLKDLTVFLCIVLFGRPALLIVPIAYAIADLIEGVPPQFLLEWFPGYFMNPACFWVGYQLFGRRPDFRRRATWGAYLLFVFIFMSVEPQLWGYICSTSFTPVVAYRSVTPALFLTTGLTWLVAPLAMLVALPLARRVGLFWAELPDHVQERRLGHGEWSSRREVGHGIPIRAVIAAPFGLLVLVMVGSTAFLALRSARADATMLAHRLLEESADELDLELTERQDRPRRALRRLLGALAVSEHGRAFILDRSGALVASSPPMGGRFAGDEPAAVASGAVAGVLAELPRLEELKAPLRFQFHVVTPRPPWRETWLGRATAFVDPRAASWIAVTALPESYYLQGHRSGSSQSAMAFALFLIVSLVVAAQIGACVTAPICTLAAASDAFARDDPVASAPSSRLAEVQILSRSFEAMTRDLRETHRQLVAAKETAEAADRVKTELLDVAAHELRTPLTPMIISVQLAERLLREGKPVEPVHVDRIARQVRRLTDLVDDLLNLTRLERGDGALRRAPMDLVALVRGCLDDFRRSSPSRAITYTGPASPLLLEADSTRVYQVLSNLLDNALKYSPAATPVDVVVTASAGKVRVAVVDRGPGIPVEKRKEVFVKFYRLGTDLTLKEPGLGLGLYICRRLVELHGGTIEIAGDPGQGCTVFFELPVDGSDA